MYVIRIKSTSGCGLANLYKWIILAHLHIYGLSFLSVSVWSVHCSVKLSQAVSMDRPLLVTNLQQTPACTFFLGCDSRVKVQHAVFGLHWWAVCNRL